MKRLVRTSAGWLELDINHLGLRGLGISVRAASFGGAGWASVAETWVSHWQAEHETLSAFLGRIAGIPHDEAEQIGKETLTEWRRRGGEEHERRGVLEMIGVVAVIFGLAGIGALALVVAAVLMLLKLL